MLAAGTETTTQTLSAITYHMLEKPDMLKRLKAELEEAIPDPAVLPNAIPIEKLPYLVSFCVHGKLTTLADTAIDRGGERGLTSPPGCNGSHGKSRA